MNDSNWKKLIGLRMFKPVHFSSNFLNKFLAKSLMEKWKRAVSGLHHTKLAFDELSARLNPEWLKRWEELEAKAVKERGSLLQIYDVSLPNGMFYINFRLHFN